MRQAGTLPNKQDAERFANYLLTLGITTKVDPAGSDWSIWVHDESQLSRSRDELQQFVADAGNARYQDAERDAQRVRRETAEKQRKLEKNYVDMRNEWAKPWRRRRVTGLLIAISIGVAILRELGNVDVEPYLLISKEPSGMPEIAAGQLWRLVTPIFLHFGIIHLVFNMWMLAQLGSLVEIRLGPLRYALLVLLIAVIPNLAQFFWAGPYFGGMSGVVYGLFGYAWLRGRLDPTSGLYLRSETVFILMLWFMLCVVGVIPNVANAAHAGGLVVGAVLGSLPAILRRERR